jgi:ATP phosphoribosyltransferase
MYSIQYEEILLIKNDSEGRLQQATLDLLAGSDVNFRRDHRLDIALVKELPIALVFLPAADIPTFVGEGKVNLGITGWDQVAEHEAATPPRENASVTKVLNLGFGACKLQVQVPENGTIQHPKELIGKNVVTSFVNLARSYFEQLELEDSGQIEDQIEETRSARPLRTRIRYVGGSVEAACALGVADGIVDLVGMFLVEFVSICSCITESGETMRAAGLKPIDTVVSSTAVLIKSRRPALPGNEKMVELITERIKGVISEYSRSFHLVIANSSKSCSKVRLVPIQHSTFCSCCRYENHSWKKSSNNQFARSRRVGGCQFDGRKGQDCQSNGRIDFGRCKGHFGVEHNEFKDIIHGIVFLELEKSHPSDSIWD